MLISGMALAVATAAAHAQSQPFRDCLDCPEMVAIPPGSFIMGVPPGEEERERVPLQFAGLSVPQHRVTIGQGFALGRFLVTRGEFAAFVRDTGYQTGDRCWVFSADIYDRTYKFQEKPGFDWRRPGFAQTDRHPVTCVSFNDATAYVEWLSRKTGRTYRLPSESEWEYAARAGSPSARFWGDDRSQACRYANVADLTMFRALKLELDPEWNFDCLDGFTYTAPVGSFESNAFGLYDMLGNLWEWVEDCWNKNYQGAPTDGSAWISGECGRRVGRGGSWSTYARNIRVGYRSWGEPGNHGTNDGFRVARTQ